MSNPSLFKWRHFSADLILLYVRCYLRYSTRLSRSLRDDASSDYNLDRAIVHLLWCSLRLATAVS
jgi:hypothetical protein